MTEEELIAFRKVKALMLLSGKPVPRSVSFALSKDRHDYAEALLTILTVMVNGNLYRIVQDYDDLVIERQEFNNAINKVSRYKAVTKRPFREYKRMGYIIKELFERIDFPLTYKMIREGDKLRKVWMFRLSQLREDLNQVDSKLAELLALHNLEEKVNE